jgi:preprotein translocase SecE subunit
MSLKDNWNWLKKFLKEVWNEADPKEGNVIWPSKQEIGKTTVAVIVTIGIAAAYIGLLDYVFANLLKLIFG